MTYPATRAFLALSGTIGLFIGFAILFIPHAFFASNQVTLGADPNLMSEIRAPGGLLLAAGSIMILGSIKTRVMRLALLMGALVFSTYGVSRLVSLAFDGVPSSTLIGALVIELAVGGTAALLVTNFEADQSQPLQTLE